MENIYSGEWQMVADIKDLDYISKGFPVRYDNKDFPTSEDFIRIQKNLDSYFKRASK